MFLLLSLKDDAFPLCEERKPRVNGSWLSLCLPKTAVPSSCLCDSEKLFNDDRAVGHAVSIWGSGHFLPEMSWSTHPLCSLICTFFPPSLFFLQAEYLWQGLYFINDISVCRLIFMQPRQWIYNIKHAASFVDRLNVMQRDKTGSGIHTGWHYFLLLYTCCMHPPFTYAAVPFGDHELSPFYKHQLRNQQFYWSIGM